MDSSEICRAALAKWGPVKQTIMAFEEMSELQKELCKNQRGARQWRSGTAAGGYRRRWW